MRIDGLISSRPKVDKVLLCIVSLSGMISALNTGTMYVAYVEFMAYFQADINVVQWLTVIYSVSSAMLTPVAGYFAQRYGLKKVFIFALMLMGSGSVLCMLAGNIHLLILFRGLQGMAGGILTPLSLTIIYQFVPKEQQGQFMSFNLMAMSLGPAIGPTLSGIMLDTIGWKGIFFCNLPLIAINGYLAYKKLPQQSGQNMGKLDYWAMLTVFGGTMLLLLSFNQAAAWGWYSTAFWSCAMLGCGLIIYFVCRQLSSAVPLLNFQVFKSRKFILSVIITATMFCNITAGAFLLPYYLQNVLKLSAIQTGALLFLPASCMVVATPVGGWLYSRFSGRLLIGVGLFIMTLGTVQIAYLGVTPTVLTLLLWMSLRYVGAAIANVPAMDYGLGDIPKQWSGHATAME